MGIREDSYGPITYVTRDPTEFLDLLGSDYESVIAGGVEARKFGPGDSGLWEAKIFAYDGRDTRLRPGGGRQFGILLRPMDGFVSSDW